MLRNVVGTILVFVALGCGGRELRQPAQPSQPATVPTSPPTTRPATSQTLRRFEYRKVYMWMPVRLVVYAESEEQAQDACRAAYDRVGEIDDRMTDYRPTSELSRLSKRSGEGPVKVSDELFSILNRAQEVSRLSNGAFDVTIGPVIQLWREARKNQRLPDPAQLAEARQRVGYQKMRLDPTSKTVTLTEKGMKLDLGGIAKGYAGDEAIRVLREHNIPRAFFECGGDIVAGDPPPDSKGWGVEVTGQLDDAGNPLVLYLKNQAISTSGDTEQFVIIDGQRYSHIVNPHTGVGLTDRIQVNVLADKGLTTDPWSTTYSVLGFDASRKLAATQKHMTVWVRQARE